MAGTVRKRSPVLEGYGVGLVLTSSMMTTFHFVGTEALVSSGVVFLLMGLVYAWKNR